MLDIPAAATLSGRVTDASGKPIAGAAVWLSGLLCNKPLEGVMSARTDQEGRYAITDLRPWDAVKEKPITVGKNTVAMVTGCCFSVLHPDYALERPMYRKIPDVIDVRLQPAAKLEGRVRRPGHRQAGRKRARVPPGNPGNQRHQDPGYDEVSRTDEEGLYRFTSLARRAITSGAGA